MEILERYRLAQNYSFDSLMSKVYGYAVQPCFYSSRDEFVYAIRHKDGWGYKHVDLPKREVRSISADEYRLYAYAVKPKKANSLSSPDKRWELFIKDFDLWIRNKETEEERPLSTNGVEHWAYAQACGTSQTQATRKIRGKAPDICAVWSADSRFILTHKIDERSVREQFLVYNETPGDEWPSSYTYKLGAPFDKNIPVCRYVIYEIPSFKERIVDRGCSVGGAGSTLSEQPRAWWGADMRTVFFVDYDRGYRNATFCAVDACTGEWKELFSLQNEIHVENTVSILTPMTLCTKDIAGGTKLLYCSDADGYCHLYLRELDTGIERKLTTGHWNVRELLHVDEEKGELFFTASGVEPDEWPYYRQLYRLALDGGDITRLTHDACDYDFLSAPSRDECNVAYAGNTVRPLVSPSGRYFIATCSSKQMPPVLSVFDSEGRETMELEHADASEFYAMPGVLPEMFRLTPPDGAEDICGMIYRPGNLINGEKYPVIEHIYNNQSASKLDWEKGFWGNVESPPFWQMCANLGFVVVLVDGRGTCCRSKAFKSATYGNILAAGLDDSVYAIRTLAESHPYMDTERVGVIGGSMGGLNALAALIRYPDFYKSAAIVCSSIDERYLNSDFAEYILGPYEKSVFEKNSILTYADKLNAPILMGIPDMDEIVAAFPQHKLLERLIARGCDVEAFLLPGFGHDGIKSYYSITKLINHMMRTLRGELPAKGFIFGEGLKYIGESVDGID